MSSDLHGIPVTEVPVPCRGLYIPPPASPVEKRVYGQVIEVFESARRAIAADRADEAEQLLRVAADLLDPARRQSPPLARPEPVELTGPGFTVRVLGVPKRLTRCQHAVVSFLLSKSPAGVTKAELERNFGHPLGVLRRLMEDDPEWIQVIQMARGAGGGYRITRTG